jgi:hypothetical protein
MDPHRERRAKNESLIAEAETYLVVRKDSGEPARVAAEDAPR